MPIRDQALLPILRWIIANASSLMGVFAEVEKFRGAANWTERVAPAQAIIGTVFPLLDSAPLSLEQQELSVEALDAECQNAKTQADSLGINWDGLLGLAELILAFLRDILGQK